MANLKIAKELFNLIYPIGSVFISKESTNPETLFGGTWERIKGKVIVGVDENDSDFNMAQKIGGSKYTEKHTHESTIITKALGDTTGATWGEIMRANANNGQVEYKTDIYTSNSYFGQGNSGNLQPYITLYIWMRIS